MSDAHLDGAVALVGMAGRFPGAADVEQLWENLRAGREGITFFTPAELEAAGVDPRLLTDPAYVPASGVLAGADLFDAGYFGMSAREAELLDPQQRVFLECCVEALEDAACDPRRTPGAIGVYAGESMNSYLLELLRHDPEAAAPAHRLRSMLANDKDHLATRVSYKLDLRGPSLVVQTACSTSLVAVHLACEALLGRQCDVALAGGVSVRADQEAGYLYAPDGILAPDGRCRAFDARAQGTVPGSGVGVVVLKRLADALADGDRVRAVIRGSALNNDGALKLGYSAPSVEGQAAVIAEALAVAGVDPGTVSLVEAHGTGTPLGDPIELAALRRAFGPPPAGAAPSCAIGSIKSQIGHLDAAAGIAGLIKAALALERREMPPTLHFERVHPDLGLAGSRFFVNAALRPWPAGPQGRPRRAGVSSFGMGGTNVHVVLEEAPPAAPASPPARFWQLLPVSAKSAAAAAEAARRLAEHLRRRPEQELADVAFTCQLGRYAHPHRRAVVARTREEAAARLAADGALGSAGVAPAAGRRAAFLFPGQGALAAGIGAELYRAEPVFRREVDLGAERLRPLLGRDLRDLLVPVAAGWTDWLDEAALVQPALCVVELALARLWMDWGIRPAALLGHSLGEYTAACLAGVMDTEDFLALVAARGRLIAGLPRGAMLAVPLDPSAAAEAAAEAGLEVAAINGPARCVLTGPFAAVEEAERRLAARGISGRRLPVSHAFHSAALDPILAAWEAEVRKIALRPPSLPVLSNVTGRPLLPEEATDPVYWVRHLREPVRFADGLAALLADDGLALLEVGPGRALTTLARRHPAYADGRVAVASLGTGPREEDPGEAASLLAALGELWTAGVEVDWAALSRGERRRRVSLPSYPFERRRYWVARTAPEAPRVETGAPVLAVPGWRREARPAARPDGVGTALLARGAGVFAAGLAEALAERLRRDGWRMERNPSGPEPLRLVLLGPSLPELPAFAGEAARLQAELVVVTAGGAEVTGGEPLDPEAAAVAAGLPALAADFPGLRVRAIDMASGDVDLLTRELRDGSEPVVALRGGFRWVPAPAPLPPAAVAPESDGAVWLITEGRSDLGLRFARRLAREGRVRLAVVEPPGFPAADAVAAVDLLERRIAGQAGPPAAARPELQPLLAEVDRLCASSMLDLWRGAGIDTAPGARISRRDLAGRLELRPAYERYLDFLVAQAAADGLVEVRDGEIEMRPAAAALPPPETLRAAIEARHPEMRGALHLLAHCMQAAPAVLRGDLQGVAALFPDGGSDLLEAANRSLQGYSDQGRAIALAAQTVSDMAAASSRRLRILEVGGGHGLLTWELAPWVARRAEYTFTDLGRSFVLQAEREAARRGLPLRCGELDIARDPAPQGYAEESFDVVLALNVVHATPRIADTLGHLRRLLRPGGLLLLLENARIQRWVEMVWGLTEEWWGFADAPLRQGSPLLGAAAWEEVLAGQGWSEAAAFPRVPERRAASDCVLVMGRRPAGPEAVDLPDPAGWTARKNAHLQALQEAGAELLVLARDLAVPGEAAAAVAQVRGRFGAVDGVFHAAGGGDLDRVGGVLPGRVATAWRSAAAATEALSAALADDPPARWLLCAAPEAGEAGTLHQAAAAAGLAMQARRGGAGGERLAVRWHDPDGAALGWRDSGEDPAVEPLVVALVAGEPEVVVAPGASPRVEPAAEPPRPARQASHSRPALDTPYEPPRDDLERRIAALLSEQLGVVPVGLHDDFFALGGDSLVAVQVIGRLREELGVKLPLRALMDGPSVAAIAALLRTAAAPEPSAPPEADIEDLLAAVESLSPEQAAALLASRRAPSPP